jgi:hypothetical protein
VATFHVALEDEDGRIALVPLKAEEPPAIGATVTFEGGARGVVERVSEIEDVALYHVKRTA